MSDQTVKLCFNIWPFVTMKSSPQMQQICQSRFNILPNNFQILPKTCKILLDISACSFSFTRWKRTIYTTFVLPAKIKIERSQLYSNQASLVLEVSTLQTVPQIKPFLCKMLFHSQLVRQFNTLFKYFIGNFDPAYQFSGCLGTLTRLLHWLGESGIKHLKLSMGRCYNEQSILVETREFILKIANQTTFRK